MKIFGFIHIATLGDWEFVINEQLKKISDTGLKNITENISISIIGNNCNKFNLDDDKIKVCYKSFNIEEYEFPILKLLKDTCENNDCIVWYIHTKGVSKGKDKKSQVDDWRLYMEYFIIENYKICIESLNDYDICGVNWRKKPQPHYSGNFWWARSKYILTLPPFTEIFIKDRRNAEFWIGKNNNAKPKILFESGINHYRERFTRERYETT